ncbi:MAG: hypothetical protein KDB90_18445 [Planctomycetes bacterium]|nr:hypothetical protein [Planctomycetota bacterium]
MSDREHLELLASRFFDGDLSPSEKSELDAALATDAELRALHAELGRVHNSISLLAEQRLPAGFKDRILQALDVDEEVTKTNVIQLPTAGWRHWAAAAAVVMLVSLLVAAAAFNNNGMRDGTVAYQPPTPKGGSVGSGDAPIVAPSTKVVAFSDGEFELKSQKVTQRTSRFEGNVSLPAQISAPADTHAVIEVKGGTAVLSPGSSARLTDVDADGIPDIEPIDGDMYLESAGANVRSRYDGMAISVDGGLTLRRTATGYDAEPSHGGVVIGDAHFGFRQCASLGVSGVEVRDCPEAMLDDWAIRGRADGIKQQLKKILGERYERIPAAHWKQWDKLLRGVLSQPSQSATYAYVVRFFVKYDFFEAATPEELSAWETIADLLAEGTSEGDIPVQMLEAFKQAEDAFDKDPQALADFKTMLRESIERMAENHRRHHGG